MTMSLRLDERSFGLGAFLLITYVDSLQYLISQGSGTNSLPIGSVTLAIFLFIVSVDTVTRRSLNWPVLAGLAIVLLFIGSALLAIYSSPHRDSAWMALFLWYACYGLCGYLLGKHILTKPFSRPVRLVLFVAIIAFAAGVFYYRDWPFNENYNYLRVASGLYFTLLIYASTGDHALRQIMAYSAGAWALYMINSRASFYIYLLTPGLFLLFSGRFGMGKKVVMASVLAAVALTGIHFVLPWDEDELRANRVLRLVFVNEQDTSLNYRNMLFEEGLNQIRENPILGYYQGYLDYGTTGSYIHNILSFWHNYGLIPFVFLIATFLIFYIRTLRARGAAGLTALKAIVTSVAIVSFAAKSHVSASIFFALGMAMSTARQAHRTTSHPRSA